MKAIVFDRHGGPEVLEYRDVPIPFPKEGEVVVRVDAASINHLDIWVRMGLPGPSIPLPHISGCDGAGKIAEIGKNVTGLSKDQKVFIFPGLSCGKCKACRTGWDSLCPSYRIIGYQTQGTFAEYAAIPEENAVPIPENLTGNNDAAAVPLVFLTAYHMLFTRAKLKAGETVLVMAAASGVGSAAIQLAKAAGARVIAAAGSPAKLELAKRLGADLTIDYQREDLKEGVRSYTQGEGTDVVIEHTGGENFAKCIHALARNGRLVTCGSTSAPEISMNIRLMFVKHANIMGSYMGARWEFLEVLKLFERGLLKPVVDRTFPLKETREAQLYIESRKNLGKILLRPSTSF